MSSLSVCLIVKNEEKVLERCLKNVQKFADEIIVVDTVSTDNTKQIAKKFTEKIFDFKWCDDFSKARNFSFSKATKNYIMWLDADDVITSENIQKIIDQKANLTADVYMCKYATNFDEKNKPTFVFYRERILKNSSSAIWQGFVHEAIAPFGKIVYLDICIEHRKIGFSDPKRNLKIYQKALKNNTKFNAREQYYYAKELYYNFYYKKCEKELKKFLKMLGQFLPNTTDAILTLSRCFFAKKDYKNSNKILLKFLEKNEGNAEIFYQLAQNFEMQNITQNAISFYNLCLSSNPNISDGYFVNTNYYSLYPLISLSVIFFKMGDINQGKIYHNKAKKLFPKNSTILENDKYFK